MRPESARVWDGEGWIDPVQLSAPAGLSSERPGRRSLLSYRDGVAPLRVPPRTHWNGTHWAIVPPGAARRISARIAGLLLVGLAVAVAGSLAGLQAAGGSAAVAGHPSAAPAVVLSPALLPAGWQSQPAPRRALDAGCPGAPAGALLGAHAWSGPSAAEAVQVTVTDAQSTGAADTACVTAHAEGLLASMELSPQSGSSSMAPVTVDGVSGTRVTTPCAIGTVDTDVFTFANRGGVLTVVVVQPAGADTGIEATVLGGTRATMDTWATLAS